MKTAILTAILVLSNIAFAGPAKPVKVATLAESKAYVESKDSLKAYKEAAQAGKLTDPAKKEMIRYLGELTNSLSGLNSTNLEILISIRPESLAKIIHLASLAKSGKADEQGKAEKDLQLLSLAGKYTNMSKVEAETVEKITEMADYNEAAKAFKTEMVKALELNIARNITEAVSTASKGKITLDQIKSCMI